MDIRSFNLINLVRITMLAIPMITFELGSIYIYIDYLTYQVKNILYFLIGKDYYACHSYDYV